MYSSTIEPSCCGNQTRAQKFLCVVPIKTYRERNTKDMYRWSLRAKVSGESLFSVCRHGSLWWLGDYVSMQKPYCVTVFPAGGILQKTCSCTAQLMIKHKEILTHWHKQQTEWPRPLWDEIPCDFAIFSLTSRPFSLFQHISPLKYTSSKTTH